MDIQVGDILTMKKQHPCGCGREVMGPRAKFEKMIRQVDRKET